MTPFLLPPSVLFLTVVQPEEVTSKRPKPHPVRRILGRIGSRFDTISGASGDERDSIQVTARGTGRAGKLEETCQRLDSF